MLRSQREFHENKTKICNFMIQKHFMAFFSYQWLELWLKTSSKIISSARRQLWLKSEADRIVADDFSRRKWKKIHPQKDKWYYQALPVHQGQQRDRLPAVLQFTPNNNSYMIELITTLFSLSWASLLSIINSSWHVPFVCRGASHPHGH